MSDEILKDFRERLGSVIRDYCNTHGCENCGLKWDDGCSATDLQDKIMDIEMEEFLGDRDE
jgi:hypothetical protein